MSKYEVLLSFTKKDVFVFLGVYLAVYGVLNIFTLFLKDIFFILFK